MKLKTLGLVDVAGRLSLENELITIYKEQQEILEELLADEEEELSLAQSEAESDRTKHNNLILDYRRQLKRKES